jgi:hypothetical protein
LKKSLSVCLLVLGLSVVASREWMNGLDDLWHMAMFFVAVQVLKAWDTRLRHYADQM